VLWRNTRRFNDGEGSRGGAFDTAEVRTAAIVKPGDGAGFRTRNAARHDEALKDKQRFVFSRACCFYYAGLRSAVVPRERNHPVVRAEIRLGLHFHLECARRLFVESCVCRNASVSIVGMFMSTLSGS
jgi:hypothetical protein